MRLYVGCVLCKVMAFCYCRFSPIKVKGTKTKLQYYTNYFPNIYWHLTCDKWSARFNVVLPSFSWNSNKNISEILIQVVLKACSILTLYILFSLLLDCERLGTSVLNR